VYSPRGGCVWLFTHSYFDLKLWAKGVIQLAAKNYIAKTVIQTNGKKRNFDSLSGYSNCRLVDYWE
jgi:hypothetical protein